MTKVSATEYLSQPNKYPPRPVCVAYGNDLFLRSKVLRAIRHAVLGDEEGDFSLTTFEGRTAEFREVAEELTTLAMFGAQRLVVVEGADEGARAKTQTSAAKEDDQRAGDDEPAAETGGFVNRYRKELENYVAKPGRTGHLLLDVKSWPSNTRLYKAVDAEGLAVDCNAPTGATLTRWVNDWAKRTHKIEFSAGAAATLVELIGPELGLIDQELAKLALLGGDKKITSELVQKHVGGWQAKTTWDMLDMALDGNIKAALTQVDRLLASSQVPIGILAQISASLRRLAAATRLILQAEAAGRKIGVGPALQQAGVKAFALQKSEAQLRRLGRQRGQQIYRWLLEADLDLKGDSLMPPRLILERLIIRLAAPA